MNKNTLTSIIKDQRQTFSDKNDFVPRLFPVNLIKTKKIVAVSGVRRSGKSTLLKQLSAEFPLFYYLNFEDERLLDFSATDFNSVYELCLTLYGDKGVFFFDEIQDVRGWEKFASRLYADGYKVYITGSNAKLLSSELSTALTGRHLKHELYPFSFAEYLAFLGKGNEVWETTKKRAEVNGYFDRYLEDGGFPEIVKGGGKEDLKQLYQDILIKDLIVRFKIRDTKGFREFALFLISHVGSKISYNNLKTVLGFKSTASVKNFAEHLESAYLNFFESKFDYSLKKQIVNDKKVYSIDTGLVNSTAFANSRNSGHLLENAVYLELRRRGSSPFYYMDKNGREVDFYSRDFGLIQVAWVLDEPETREREMSALLAAMDELKLKNGTIITRNEEDEIKRAGKKISVVPAWKWLLGLEK